MSDITTVGVLGCGLMGSGIAQVAVVAGFRVLVRDTQDAALEKGRREIERSLGKFVEKGKLSAEARDAALGRLGFVRALEDLAGCELVIEAITEDLALKNQLWTTLDQVAMPGTIFASNTSSLPIAAMAAVTSRPDRFVGLHFFSPVPMMPLVEVVRAVTTSPQTMQAALAFVRRLGKEAVSAKDTPGFIVNLLLIPYMLDAVRAVERGVATTADVDTAMRLGAGHPMGPLALGDFVGLDVVDRVAEIMFNEFRETRYASPPLLRRLVTVGWLGRKSGKGFYDYSAEPPTPTRLDD
jgi:3-hydroxybutyryl-CoA dehydrogenase